MSSFIKLYSDSQPVMVKNQRTIQTMAAGMLKDFLLYYSDSRVCKERFVFKESDFDKLCLLIFDFDRKELDSRIKELSKNPSWKVINQSENIILLFIIRHFYMNKDVVTARQMLLLLSQRLFSGLLVKYFPHGCNQMVMDYSINSLSNYFLLGKYDGDINRTIAHTAEGIFRTYEKKTIAAKNDDDMLYLLIVLRTSINSFLKNASSVYYKVFNEKLYLSANQTVYDESGSDISEFADNNSNVMKVRNSLNTYINRIGVDPVTIKKISRVTQTREGLVEELFLEILKDEESNRKMLNAIFTSFENMSTNVCDRSFVIKTVNYLNSKYDSNKVKPVSEELLIEKIKGYKSLSSNSKSKYRRALVLLYGIYLQKANCGG